MKGVTRKQVKEWDALETRVETDYLIREMYARTLYSTVMARFPGGLSLFTYLPSDPPPPPAPPPPWYKPLVRAWDELTRRVCHATRALVRGRCYYMDDDY